MPPTLNEVAIPKIPVASTTDGVVHIDATASSQRFAIPAAWRGRVVTCVVTGEAVEILFGDSTVAVTFEDASTVAAEAITMKVTTGVAIPAGGSRDYFVPRSPQATHFAIRAASTTGKIYMHASSP